jgi:NADP-dependent 3-hydroxy acid dehydrogenase YdfG
MPKVAIITGASSGIGKGLAIRYASAGYHVGLIARRKTDLLALQAVIPTNSLIGVCDVSQREAVTRCVHRMIEAFGRIDVLIANAGISEPSPAQDANFDALESTININVLGAGFSAYAAIPTMIQQRSGHVAVIGSLASYRGFPEAGAYCASKAAVNALFESMRLDLKPWNISVSIIHPGFIDSAITQRNNFTMPFLKSLDDGCDVIFKSLIKKKKKVSFPWPLSWAVKYLAVWPCWLYDLVFSNLKYKGKRPTPLKTKGT